MKFMFKKVFEMNFGSYSLVLNKKRRQLEKNEPDCANIPNREEYERFFKRVNQWLLERNEKEEKLQLLTFLLDIVKRDIQMDLLSEIYYKQEENITNLTRKRFIPLWYVDELGNKNNLDPVNKRQVDFSETVTIVIPWKGSRMGNAIIDIAREGFIYDEQEHLPAYYFSEIDLCYVLSGNHHISAGIIQESGYVEADVYDITKLFDHVLTDGECWFNAHTGKRLKFVDVFKRETYMTVFDFRVAVIYELARMKYRVQDAIN